MRVLIAKAATPGCLRPLSVVVALGHMETGRGGGAGGESGASNCRCNLQSAEVAADDRGTAPLVTAATAGGRNPTRRRWGCGGGCGAVRRAGRTAGHLRV